MAEHPALTNDTNDTNDASMLTRRFGKEVTNYFAGSRLNRYSFLRSDAGFLGKAATSPHARFMVLDDLRPLVADQDGKRLALLRYSEVEGVLGASPAARGSDEERVRAFDSSRVAAEVEVVFLGIAAGAGHDDGDGGGDAGGDMVWESSGHGEVRGRPYFAIDVSRGRGGREREAWVKSQGEKNKWVALDSRSLTLHSEHGV